MALVKQKQLVENDPWLLLEDSEEIPADGAVIVGLARFVSDHEALSKRGHVGVRIDPTDDALALEGKLQNVPVVAIHFPKFGDGRGYSKARIVREQLGFDGELRAVGDVLPDQLFYMQRCGIDAFALKEGKDPAQAIACLDDHDVTYQGAADDPRPLYRRRA